ncbi:AAA family ATPase [Rhodoferax aquaticus]|uniref:Transcriptional regulator n=1 Tax=Rhodoferax aquaticus TaxID=2527691 RepID=A0A515ESY6_9BURK|nr:AAA family ATPase [Rhodoferax aquaticus]QDL55786.1 transcriptional regulator [Rhodoferax aquaticus]
MQRIAFQHSLVIGKFYPPHLGHEYLMRTASQHSASVTVLVLGASAERISIANRVAWLQDALQENPNIQVIGALGDVPVDYLDDAIWQAHVDIMKCTIEAAQQSTPGLVPVDAVFSSEPYGERLAHYFAARHVCLDQSRSLYPVSGTAVRADVPGQWHMLSPAVQAGLALRVVVVGAESTGTTTLSQDLAKSLRQQGGVWSQTRWVAEYGREYSAKLLALAKAANPRATALNSDWRSSDFEHIARTQCALEEQAARHGCTVLVCDTDALATCIWHERHMGQHSDALAAIAKAMPPRALYVLTSEVDVPFEDDGLRDGEHLRCWMNQRFRDVLTAQSVPWLEVTGSPEERCRAAMQALAERQTNAHSFAAISNTP